VSVSLPSINESRVLTTFLDLVRIDSPTFEEQAVGEVLAERLRSLGLLVSTDRSGPDGVGNVIGLGPSGRVDALLGASICLCAHTDTVQPGRGIKPIVADGVVRSDLSTILGADNKQAVAAILEAVQTVIESGAAHRAFDVLFTWGEEKGHLGAHGVDFEALSATSAFVFDAGDDIGTIITETPTAASMVATFHGVAAHAGMEPEKGINAIQAAAIAISKMRLGRLDADTTANVGLIEGGTVRNAVPAKTVVQMETRSMRQEALEEQVAAMTAACHEGASAVGGAADVDTKFSYQGFRLAPDDPLVLTAADALRRAGFEPKLGRTGGGSDANTLQQRGMPAVNLGTAMRDLHSVRENVRVQDIIDLARVIVALLVR
jgi:tripeptide aminopeptidase